MRGSRFCCLCFFLGDVQETEIYRLGSSHAINECLQDQIDAKRLLIARVTLKTFHVKETLRRL